MADTSERPADRRHDAVQTKERWNMRTGRGATSQRLLTVGAGMLFVAALGVGPAFGTSTSGTSTSGTSTSGTSTSGTSTSLTSTSLTSTSLTSTSLTSTSGTSTSGTSTSGTSTSGTSTSGTSTSGTSTSTSSGGQCAALQNALNQASAQFQSVLDQIEASPLGAPLGALLGQLEAARTQFQNAQQALFNNPLCNGTSTSGSSSGGSGTEIRYETDPGSSYGRAPGIYSPYGRYADYQQQPVYATQVGSVPRGGVATGDGSFQP